MGQAVTAWIIPGQGPGEAVCAFGFATIIETFTVQS